MDVRNIGVGGSAVPSKSLGEKEDPKSSVDASAAATAQKALQEGAAAAAAPLPNISLLTYPETVKGPDFDFGSDSEDESPKLAQAMPSRVDQLALSLRRQALQECVGALVVESQDPADLALVVENSRNPILQTPLWTSVELLIDNYKNILDAIDKIAKNPNNQLDEQEGLLLQDIASSVIYRLQYLSRMQKVLLEKPAVITNTVKPEEKKKVIQSLTQQAKRIDHQDIQIFKALGKEGNGHLADLLNACAKLAELELTIPPGEDEQSAGFTLCSMQLDNFTARVKHRIFSFIKTREADKQKTADAEAQRLRPVQAPSMAAKILESSASAVVSATTSVVTSAWNAESAPVASTLKATLGVTSHVTSNPLLPVLKALNELETNPKTLKTQFDSMTSGITTIASQGVASAARAVGLTDTEEARDQKLKGHAADFAKNVKTALAKQYEALKRELSAKIELESSATAAERLSWKETNSIRANTLKKLEQLEMLIKVLQYGPDVLKAAKETLGFFQGSSAAAISPDADSSEDEAEISSASSKPPAEDFLTMQVFKAFKGLHTKTEEQYFQTQVVGRFKDVAFMGLTSLLCPLLTPFVPLLNAAGQVTQPAILGLQALKIVATIYEGINVVGQAYQATKKGQLLEFTKKQGQGKLTCSSSSSHQVTALVPRDVQHISDEQIRLQQAAAVIDFSTAFADLCGSSLEDVSNHIVGEYNAFMSAPSSPGMLEIQKRLAEEFGRELEGTGAEHLSKAYQQVQKAQFQASSSLTVATTGLAVAQAAVVGVSTSFSSLALWSFGECFRSASGEYVKTAMNAPGAFLGAGNVLKGNIESGGVGLGSVTAGLEIGARTAMNAASAAVSTASFGAVSFNSSFSAVEGPLVMAPTVARGMERTIRMAALLFGTMTTPEFDGTLVVPYGDRDPELVQIDGEDNEVHFSDETIFPPVPKAEPWTLGGVAMAIFKAPVTVPMALISVTAKVAMVAVKVLIKGTYLVINNPGKALKVIKAGLHVYQQMSLKTAAEREADRLARIQRAAERGIASGNRPLAIMPRQGE